MEVLLNKDIPSLGIANEVVVVKSGYARNFLLPQGLAVVATEALKKERAHKIALAAKRKEERISEAQQLAERMEKISVQFERKSSEEGKLFGSVTKDDIVTDLQKSHLIEVDRKQIHMDSPLKQVGETQVKIRLESGVSAFLNVIIMPEGGELPISSEEITAGEKQVAESAEVSA